jgi:hypothetical protein
MLQPIEAMGSTLSAAIIGVIGKPFDAPQLWSALVALDAQFA